MKLVCPVCDNEKDLKSIKVEKEVTIRNEPIKVEVQCYKCPKCDEEFLVPESTNDPFAKAYSVYRTRKNLLQPSELRSFRNKYSLTQGELANLLGFGGATISRYESGKLQDESQDKLLRLAMEPECLKKLVEESVDVFSDEKKKKILGLIERKSEPKVDSLKRFILFSFSTDEVNEYSGYKKFDMDKFTNAVLYFCKEGVLKTKLNKLLFYTDFLHFKDYSVSITGAQYAHIPFGPAPHDYDFYYPLFVRQGSLIVEEIEYPNGAGDNYTSKKNPDLNVFSENELRVLATVKERFKNYGAGKISNFSHQEKAYKETQNGDIISYLYAKELNFISHSRNRID
jgi:putative zinc finger/helix-turn-helix YgiT family protein